MTTEEPGDAIRHTLTETAISNLFELAAVADQPPIVEHALQMSGGGMHVRNGDPRLEDIYPLAKWIEHSQRFGGKVYRRRILVIEDWSEVPASQESP